jgi:hypothetical protein
VGRSTIYVPDAELYHLERQSIKDHGGYSRGIACMYNQRLHHQRWADAIELLLRSAGSQPNARSVARNVALIQAAA